MKRLLCWFLGHSWIDVSWFSGNYGVTSFWCDRCGEDCFHLHRNLALAA